MKKKKQYNCFKFVGMLFCMLVCILLFPKETFAEESNYITVTYAKNINSGFLYSDDMMLTNANDLSTDIAKMAMGLANVAYSEKAVKQCLSDMEYSLLGGDTYNYTKNTYTYTNNDYVDYSIGYKQYKGYNIYLVVIKGTGTNYDWFSNFNLGKGDYHQGFKLAADGVLNTINSKVKTSNNIFLVTGHSRGAAVANIVAAELTADGSLASSDHIFGYTYACPAVKIGADTSYKNIRNYNNPGDAVPELPLEAWGYERYGETINLSTQSDIYQNFKQRFKSVEGENYAGVVNTDSFVSTLLALADTRDAYYNPDNHLWFDFFAYLLGPASKESIDWSVVAQIIKDNDITGATASCLIHILQDAVSTGITALSKVENSEGSWKSEFMSRIDSALLETKEYTDEEFKTWLTSKPYVVAEIRKEFHIEVETRQSLVAAQRTLESELDNYSPMLANGETLLYLFFSTDFKPVSAISHGHQPSSYVLWINSMYYGYEGWKGNTEITNVDLNGIDTIGENCFCNCTKLSRINGMNSITAFGNSAFYNLSKLKVVGKFAAQVKYIGNYAFSGCSNMTGEIKQISEYIGTSAFSGCSGITGKVILSGKLGKVSEKAFSNTGIKEVEVQDGIETIGGDAFAVCKNLEKVMIADSVRTIGRSAFEHCSSLKEITLPASAKYDTYVNSGSTTSATFVDVEAEKIVFTKGTGEVFVPETDEDWYHSNISLPWYSKDSLKEVEFEEGIEEIYAEALSGCWKVETIKIPETVKKIGDRAFANCTSWTGEVYLPPKLESIGISAFSGCSKQIGKIILLGNLRTISDSAFSNTGIEEVEVQDGIESIGGDAFASCKKLKRVIIADSVRTIGRSAFEHCSSLKEITLPISAKYDTYVNGGSTTSATFVDVQAEKIVFTKGTGEVFVPETDKDGYHSNISLPWYSKDSLKEVEFEEGIEKIYAEALSGCWKVETIKIPETVKKIGDRAFANCISWTGKMYLPPKLESIGASAFSGCGKQTGKVNLLGNLKTVSESAFANTGIEEVTVQDGIESIGEDAFASCKKLKRVIIADSVMTIGRSAFEYCSSLKEITLPISAKYDTYVNGGSTTSATFVDVQAEKIVFTKGTGEVFVPETDKDWYHSNISLPWYSKDSLKEVEFEEGIEKIYAEALSGCWKVETIKIPETVKKIGDRAFANCISWTGKMYLPPKLESIGASAFSGCGKQTGKVNLLGNLKTVSESAFANTGIEEVTVQDGIESIGEDAFASCKKLKRVIIADSVMTIGRSAFEYCSSLKEITLPISAKYDTYVNGGSTTSATFVDVQAEKIVFTKGTGEVFVPETDKDWYHSNISLPWYSKDSLKEVEFEEGIEKIYAEALSGCWKVETIKIPETVKKIGDRAFANCTSWAGELYLPKGLKSIGEGAFFNCSRLTNILVPALQTELNTNCFDSNITTVLWGLNNSTTETYAAANNITFKAINYPYLTYDNIKVLTPGQNYRFIATVFTDINESTDKVTWAIAGSVSDDTIIDASGLLSVAANESAKELTVSANYGGEISSMKFAVEMDEHEHTYEYQITKDATCTEVGIATYTCSLCGDSYMEEIPALGHDYGEWKTVKEATYTEEGLEEQICSRDPSHKQTRSIPKRKIPFSLVELQLSDTVYVYDGKEKKPTVTITYNGKVLAEGVDYSIRYSDNVNPGTATITVEAKENSSYIGSIQKKFVIRPAMEDNTVVVQPNAFEGCSNIINLNIRATVTEIGTQAFADCKNLNSIYFYGNCPKIGENIFRNVKATAYYPCNDMSWTIDRLQDYGGKITWCPWDPATGKPAKRSLSICELSVNVGTQLYDGKVKTPQVAVKDGNKVLQANVDYVVSYQNNVNPGTGTITVSGTGSYGGTLTARFTIQKGNNVISVSEITKNYSAKTQKAKTNARAYGGAGLTYASNSKSVKIDKYGRIKITKKFVGRAVITVRASETPNYRAASRQFTVTVRPSATSISKASNSAKKKMTVSWKKNKTCSGYALQYSTDKKFKKGVKTVYISKNSRTKTTVSRLAKGKTYYVRLASYKKAGNTKILSKWSKVKKVKIRK